MFGEDDFLGEILSDVAGYVRANFVEHCDRGAYLTRRTVSALEPVVFDKGGLHGVQAVWSSQAFDSGDFVALVHQRQGQAGVNPPTVNDDGTSTALAMIAPFFGACEMKMFAEDIKKRCSVVDSETLPAAVDGKGYLRV